MGPFRSTIRALSYLGGHVLDVRTGADTEPATLGWLVEALEYARSNGQTKVVGYLEAVLDDAVFEEKITVRTAPVVG
jgi:hypothetical protein